eukprot:scaffold48605_cov49-Attheya_sp.AAC.3
MNGRGPRGRFGGRRRGRGDPNNRNERLALEDMHSAVRSSITTGMEQVGETTDDFHDKVHVLHSAPRSKTKADVVDFCKKLVSAALAAGENSDYWKVLVLSIVRRRFHAKAPEARRISHEEEKDMASVNGDGERLNFYLSIICLVQLSRNERSSDHNIDKNAATSTMASKASDCLVRLAFLAGGTRDVCALLEHLVFDMLDRHGYIQMREDKNQKVSIASASRHLMQKSTPQELIPTVLEDLLSSAATMLDQDMCLVRAKDTKTAETYKEGAIPEFPSTIHTFLPHRDRGNSQSSKRARNLIQTIAELLIWSRTSSAMSTPAFVSALTQLQSTPDGNDDDYMECVHKMQTCIRRLRQELNGAAREKGFSLCSTFLMDPSALSLSMIRRGKEGDVIMLQHLASKKRDQRVLNFTALRSTDPRKAIPLQSVTALSRSWLPLPKEEEEIDDVRQLKLTLQEASVRATINSLKSNIKENDKERGNIILASLDGDTVCDASAILVAAAMNRDFSSDGKVEPTKNNDTKDNSETVTVSSPSVFFKAEEYVPNTLEELIVHLDRIFKSADDPDDVSSSTIPATTKDVQNLIERHTKAGDRLLIFTTADLKLEQRVLAKLQHERCSIHCHIANTYSSRMEREGAKVGDITATLIWDSECDLDLHAICPDRSHISYANKITPGGNLDVDMNVGGESKEPVENIFFGDAEKGIEAPRGKYKIFVQNYAYHGNTVSRGDPVPWRVRLTMNGENKEFTGACIGAGKSSDETVCEFEYNGRIAPLPEEVGSALESSNLVSVTSSVGTTLDSLSQLMNVFDQHALLGRVHELHHEEEDMDDDVNIDAEQGNDDDNAETEDEEMHECDPPTWANNDDGGKKREHSLMAKRTSFQVTNRERLHWNLSKLPDRFHDEVARAFGGPSLTRLMAASLAKRMVEDNIAISALRQAGYPDTVVESVKQEMGTFGI